MLHTTAVDQRGQAAMPGENAHIVAPAVSTHAVWSSGSAHHRARTKLARAPRNLQRRKWRGALRTRADRPPCGRSPSNRVRARRSTASDSLHSCRRAEAPCSAAQDAGIFNYARGSQRRARFARLHVAHSAVIVLKHCRSHWATWNHSHACLTSGGHVRTAQLGLAASS
ncbi:hypothetical protein E2P73_12700 [Xanthomonas perforans]|nr:hypothetical protein E2P72_08550 [Xanthomonas perforans]TVS64638.1 hypothetical protein E2P73_12700 [Xanthomonas perforans]